MPRKLVIAFYLFLLIIVMILYPSSVLQYSESMLYGTLAIVLLSLVLFVIHKEEISTINKQYIRPVILFLIGYVVVFFQAYVDLLLGYNKSDNSFLFVNSLIINQAALLSCAGLISFLLGYLLLREKKMKLKKVYLPVTYSLKWLVVLLSAFLLIFIYYNGQSYLSGSYSQEFLEEKTGTGAAYSEILFLSVYLSLIILNSKISREKNVSSFKSFFISFGWLFYLNVIIYVFLVMLSGDRGPILIVLLTYLFSYVFVTRKKIKLVYMVLGVFVGVSFFATLGIVRSMSGRDPFSTRILSVLQKKDIDNAVDSFFPASKELASSVRTFHYAIDYIPEHHPYLYGSFQLRDILSGIPFSNSISKYFLDPHFKYKSSAYFITWLHQGNNYLYGDGSSINADLYLSFGFIGVLIGLFLLGLLFRVIDLIVFLDPINKISLFLISLAFILFGTAIYMNRASFFGQIYYLTFTFIIVLIYDRIMRKIG